MSSNTPAGGFVPGVHAARAIAVVMVLLAHIFGLWTSTQGVEWLPWSAYLKVFVDTLHIDHQGGGHTGLLLFFLVSGFIVSQAAERESRTTFAVKRAARLLPAMAVAVAAAVAVGALGHARGWYPMFGFDYARALSPWTLLEGLGFRLFFNGLAALFVLWSLHVEYIWYLALTALLPVAKRRPVLTTSAMTLATAALGILGDDWHFGPVYPNMPLVPYLLIILLGRWIYLGFSGLLTRVQSAIACILVMLAYTASQYNFIGVDAFSGTYPRFLSASWAVLIFLGLLRFVRRSLWRPVAFVADISYGLYLFHIPVMWLVLPIVSPHGSNLTAGFLVTAGVLVGVAWLVERSVERPIRRFARRQLARNKGQMGVNTVAVPPV
jgi:peptidoglycan/LPS O-acetylase OafA/YrhL